MNFKMAENSLFSILLRSRWWISFLVVAFICLGSFALLPLKYAPLGALSSIPFIVIGCIALKRQWNLPTEAELQTEKVRLLNLSWRDFSAELEAKLAQQGYQVTRLNNNPADFKLEKSGYTTLVSAKRYKAATHGLEAIQALVSQRESQGADRAMYVNIGELTAPAAKFALEHGVEVGMGAMFNKTK